MAWREVLGRSFDHLKNESAKVLRASPLGPRPERELNLASLRSPQDMKQFIAGCDRDIGGMSKVSLELDSSGRGRFYGTLNAYVPPGLKVGNATVDRSGYAGMRTRTLFGYQCWDTTLYEFLRLRLRSPPPNTSASALRYFVNIQTDGPIQSDLFQHRLWLSSAGDWEDVLIPFSDFTLTNSGEIAEKQIPMLREKVRTIGISVMVPPPGPNELQGNEDYHFDLGIESFDCVNIVERLPRKAVLSEPPHM